MIVDYFIKATKLKHYRNAFGALSLRELRMIKRFKRYRELSIRSALPLVISTLLLAACEREAPQQQAAPRLVNAMRVADLAGLAERTFPGRARAAQEVNLSFRVAGPLITFPVKVGDEVEAGDVLVRMDPKDYQTRLRGLQGQLEREQANLTRAQADLTRVQNIFRHDPGATSQAALDQAREARDAARASVHSLEAAVENARDQLSYTYLKAPFDGVVVATYVENFETAIPTQPIVRVLDPSSIEFVIDVPETLIGLSPYVEKVTVQFDALPGHHILCKVKEIGKEASQATRTYPVTLVMAQPDGAEILPGMAGKASVVGRLPEQSKLVGIQVPATAVFAREDASKSFVWIVDETTNTLSRREVEIGPLARFGVLITSGLERGEWIVTKGVHSVADGEQVRILDVTRQASKP